MDPVAARLLVVSNPRGLVLEMAAFRYLGLQGRAWRRALMRLEGP